VHDREGLVVDAEDDVVTRGAAADHSGAPTCQNVTGTNFASQFGA
jgi:hypothetical protein